MRRPPLLVLGVPERDYSRLHHAGAVCDVCGCPLRAHVLCVRRVPQGQPSRLQPTRCSAGYVNTKASQPRSNSNSEEDDRRRRKNGSNAKGRLRASAKPTARATHRRTARPAGHRPSPHGSSGDRTKTQPSGQETSTHGEGRATDSDPADTQLQCLEAHRLGWGRPCTRAHHAGLASCPGMWCNARHCAHALMLALGHFLHDAALQAISESYVR